VHILHLFRKAVVAAAVREADLAAAESVAGSAADLEERADLYLKDFGLISFIVHESVKTSAVLNQTEVC